MYVHLGLRNTMMKKKKIAMKNKEDDACVDHHVVVKIMSLKDALNALVVLKQFLEQGYMKPCHLSKVMFMHLKGT